LNGKSNNAAKSKSPATATQSQVSRRSTLTVEEQADALLQ
jgi:hypothetical protein